MNFNALADMIFDEMVPRLEDSDGAAVFARERAKFEGWLKLELCGSLSKHFADVAPERDRIDITFEDWGIELKTVNTNYRYEGAERKTRPITKNIKGVLEDIEKLGSIDLPNKAVLFIVFPAAQDLEGWQYHLSKVRSRLRSIRFREFHFNNGLPGVIYFGTV